NATSDSPADATSGGGPTSSSTAPPSAAQPTETAPDRPADLANSSSVANPVPAATVATRSRLGIYLAAQSVMGPAASIIPGISAYALAGLDRESIWSPAVMLGATHAWSGGIAEWGGTAFFTLDAASLDACALRLGPLAFEVRACGSALVGRLSTR